MMRTNSQIVLILLVFVTGVVAGVVALSLGVVPREIANVIMFFVGLFGMAAVTTLQRLVDRPGPLVQITFNEASIRQKLSDLRRDMPDDVIEAEVVEERRNTWSKWESELLGKDNTLALAKLRIDLESELRKIAHNVGIDDYATRASVRSLANALAQRNDIPVGYLSVLEDILPTLNTAIHGGKVSTETAASILRAGRDLLSMLRAHREAASSRDA
jgi:hypothetical protein